jgi:hypothetical protein
MGASTTSTLPRGARAAALTAVLAMSAGACEHAASLAPLSPHAAPAPGAESREMEALLTAVQRETRAQGPADPARDRLVAALFAATRDPAPQAPSTELPATAVPAHMEQALSRLLAAHGDSAAIAHTLRELADRDSRAP